MASQRTILGDSPKLLLLAATRALEDGMACTLLEDEVYGNLFHEYAQVVWVTALIPGSAYHWAWHDLQSVPDTAGLTRSCSAGALDLLDEHACTCSPRAADLELLQADAREQRREFAAWAFDELEEEELSPYADDELDVDPFAPALPHVD